jgi:hypothetical protein
MEFELRKEIAQKPELWPSIYDSKYLLKSTITLETIEIAITNASIAACSYSDQQFKIEPRNKGKIFLLKGFNVLRNVIQVGEIKIPRSTFKKPKVSITGNEHSYEFDFNIKNRTVKLASNDQLIFDVTFEFDDSNAEKPVYFKEICCVGEFNPNHILECICGIFLLEYSLFYESMNN